MSSRRRVISASALTVLLISIITNLATCFIGGPSFSALHAPHPRKRERTFASRTTMIDRFQEVSANEQNAADERPQERVGYAARVPSRYVKAAGGLTPMQVKQLTLVLCYDGAGTHGTVGGSDGGNRRILLGMKKRGFGQGKWNGFGGKIEEGEAIEAAALRELEEEAKVQVPLDSLERRGLLTFFFDGQQGVMQVHLFCVEAASLQGTPQETEEMRPQWFSLDAIPYPDMWADDVHWLPKVLSGENTEASFLYDAQNESSISGVTLLPVARPWPDFFSSAEHIEELLSGVPYLVTADVVRARKEVKRFPHCVRGDRVWLVAYEKTHVARYHEWMQDEALLEATCSEPLTLEEEYDMQIKWATDADKVTFMIVDEDRQLIGDINLFFYEDDEPFTCEINVMIAEEAKRKRGYGSEAVRLMLAYGWHRLGSRKFLAKIRDENIASLAMFQALGFKFEKHSAAFKQTTLVWSPPSMIRPQIDPCPTALSPP